MAAATVLSLSNHTTKSKIIYLAKRTDRAGKNTVKPKGSFRELANMMFASSTVWTIVFTGDHSRRVPHREQ